MHLCYDTVAAAKWKCAVLIIEAEGQCSPYWRRLLFFVPARGNSALVITCNQWRLRVEAALLRYFVSHNWPCVLEFIQSKGLCGATRHIGWGCVCVCGRHSGVSDSCLCVQMPFHMHALSSGFVSFPLHLSVSQVLSQSPAEQRGGSAPVSTWELLQPFGLLAQTSSGSISVQLPLELLYRGILLLLTGLRHQLHL